MCFKRTPPARRTPAKRYQIAELGRRRYPVARPRLYFHYLDRDGRGLRREELAAAARIAVFDSREFYALETVALAGVAVFGAQAGITRALPPPACVATGVTLCFGGARRPSGSWLRGGLQNARRTIFAATPRGGATWICRGQTNLRTKIRRRRRIERKSSLHGVGTRTKIDKSLSNAGAARRAL